MTETKPSSAAATAQVFESLGKLVSLAAGAIFIGYVIGWRYSDTYWGHFHASWVLDLLSPGQMLSDAGTLISPLVIAALLSILGVLTGVRERTISRWFNVLLGIGALATFSNLVPESFVPGSVTRAILHLGPWFYMGAAGVGIASLVTAFQMTNMSWNDFIANHVNWLFLVILFTGPLIWADERVELDSRAATSTLNVVTWPSQPEGDWRLGRAVDKGLIVIKLTPDPNVTEVRLLPYSIDVLIRPINQPIM
jgi:hypothetical protein